MHRTEQKRLPSVSGHFPICIVKERVKAPKRQGLYSFEVILSLSIIFQTLMQGKSLIKYLRKEVGEVGIPQKKPLFHQDFKHILDYLDRVRNTSCPSK